MSIAILTGQQLAEHTAPSPALLLTLEGQARFTSGGEQIELRPGSVVHTPPTAAHRVEATADSRFLLVR